MSPNPSPTPTAASAAAPASASRNQSVSANFRILQKSISCSCESLKCSTGLVLAAAQRGIRDRLDPDTESLLCERDRERDFSASPDYHSVGCGASSAGGDDQRSLQSDYTAADSLRVAKQNSYDSYYSGQQQLLSANGSSSNRNRLDFANANFAHNTNSSPNSCGTGSSGGVPSALADYYQQCASGVEGNIYAYKEFKKIVSYNLSNSDPITRCSHLDEANSSSLLKSHYSDCNIYAKQQSQQHFPNLKSDFEGKDQLNDCCDKQQLVNKSYIFKCIANSPSFLNTNKIREQSKKFRNLSLKARNVKKKNQIITKSNAVSDNSLHPGDKYLNLYLDEKKNSQNQQPTSLAVATGGSQIASLQSRYQQQLLANGSIKTYRSTVRGGDIKDHNGSLSLDKNHTRAKINKNCNLVRKAEAFSISTSSCNKLHAQNASTLSHKSSLSSNGQLNKYSFTDSSCRKTEFNRQLSAPTYCTRSASNGNSSTTAASEAVCGSTSTVAGAGGGGTIATPIAVLKTSLPNYSSSKQSSNSLTNSFNRRNKKQKNPKLSER